MKTVIKNGIRGHHHPNGGGWVANTATVAESAYIGEGVRVGSYAQIGNQVQIGSGVQIGNYVWIDDAVRIGDDVWVSERAWIGEGSRIGAGAWIGEEAQISKEVRIGKEAQIGNYVQIAEGSKIGNKAQISDSVVVLPDIHIPNGLNGITFQSNWLPATINDEVITSGCHVKTPDEWLTYFNKGTKDGIPKAVLPHYIAFFKWAKTMMEEKE
jgi:NDP-sugar pyrophosphorylase family protein